MCAKFIITYTSGLTLNDGPLSSKIEMAHLIFPCTYTFHYKTFK